MSIPKTLFVFTIFSTACGPLVPLTYINPPPSNSTQINVIAYNPSDNILVQTIASDDLTVSMEYIGRQHERYIFDLEINNNSSNAISIAPQAISYYASPKFFPTLDDPAADVHTVSAPNSRIPFGRLFANSPEAVKNIYRESARGKQSLGIFLTILGAGLAVYDAAKDSEDCKKEAWTEEDKNRSLGRNVLVSVAVTASDLAVQSAELANEENRNIPYELFPECKIAPGASVRGKIFIPIVTSYRYSRIVIPLGDTDFVFDFRRWAAKPAKASRVRP